MKFKGMKKLGLLVVAIAFSICMVLPGMVSAKDKDESIAKEVVREAVASVNASNSVTISRTADIVFLIDTTGSMRSAIENVRRNLNNFLNKIEQEDVNVRVRFVSFRDGGSKGWDTYKSRYATSYAMYEDLITFPGGTNTYDTTSWYTKSDVERAKADLTTGPFATLGGGWGESPMVPLAEMTKEDYFKRQNSEPKTIAKFCIIITDEPYETDALSYTSYYDEANGMIPKQYGDSTLNETSLIEKLQEKGIHTSVITTEGLYTKFGKFVTPPSNLSSNDGGMLANIYGDYDILFEKLAEKINEVTKEKEKIAIIEEAKLATLTGGGKINLNVSPIKIRANMIVLKKQQGEAVYTCVEGRCTDPDAASWASFMKQQDSPVFKELKPDTEYSFLVKTASGAGIVVQKTETETGARFGQIPKTVYEGEVFNIKPNNDIRQMLATSGGSITWSCESDCVSLTADDAGNGCRMEIKDCQFNNNQLIECTLIAEVTYVVKKDKGDSGLRTKKLKEDFKIENEVDAMDIGEFLGTSENIYKDGIIQLTTTDRVSIDMILNQGELSDSASRQKLKYYISDQWGVKNPNGRKIATVSGGGKIKGVRPGVTYITIAPRHTYNKYAKCYDFMATIPIVCQEVNEAYFDGDAMDKEDDNILNYKKDESLSEQTPGSENSDTYVVFAGVKDKIDLKPYLRFNPDPIFNAGKMKQKWVSSDPDIVTVNSKGQIRCKNPGYATITVTPTGGIKISAATGKRDVNAKPCSASIIIKVYDEKAEKEQ